jgi:hypothetical protein
MTAALDGLETFVRTCQDLRVAARPARLPPALSIHIIQILCIVSS